jgi:predicted nucleotidyltransferase
MKRTYVPKKEQTFHKTNDVRNRIMELLFRHPNREFSLSEIAKEARVSKSAASRIVGALRKNGFISVIDLKVVYRIRANVENQRYKKEKVAFNLSEVIRSEIVDVLVEKYHAPNAIVLFGSFRKGEDTEGSDIDIAVEVPGKKEIEIIGGLKEFGDFEARMGRKISVHVFSRMAVDKNLLANIMNGVLLYGFLEVH